MNLSKNCVFRNGAALLFAVMMPQAFAQSLNGAGSTFPNPIYQKWFADYRKANPGVKINYQAIGSGSGIQKLIDGGVDFAATDEPMTDEQLRAAKEKRGTEILHFPTVMGAIVPIYNVPGLTAHLNFTRAALAGIFLGKIKKWNDPEIAKANPGIQLRADPIYVVHRQDSDGSTYLWTEFLSNASPEWKAGPGTGMSVKWPTGLSAKGDEGVIGLVENTWDSIGYVEVTYALNEGVPHGNVQNRAGVFAKADVHGIAAAAASLHTVAADMRMSITNAPGHDAYPISSFTWLLVPTKQKDPGKQKAMTALLKWMLTEGQKYAEDLSYAKLPDVVLKSELVKVGKLDQ